LQSFQVEIKDLFEIGGGGVLSAKFNSSIALLLAKVYPEYEWLPWKFDRCPNNYFENVNNQRKFMEWAGKQLKIKEMSDWYDVGKMVENVKICFLIFLGFATNWRG
jgi:hypothetical protein